MYVMFAYSKWIQRQTMELTAWLYLYSQYSFQLPKWLSFQAFENDGTVYNCYNYTLGQDHQEGWLIPDI